MGKEMLGGDCVGSYAEAGLGGKMMVFVGKWM